MPEWPSKIRYDKKNVVRVSVSLNRNTEPDLIAKLEKQENKGGYIKGLIRADIKENGI